MTAVVYTEYLRTMHSWQALVFSFAVGVIVALSMSSSWLVEFLTTKRPAFNKRVQQFKTRSLRKILMEEHDVSSFNSKVVPVTVSSHHAGIGETIARMRSVEAANLGVDIVDAATRRSKVRGRGVLSRALQYWGRRLFAAYVCHHVYCDCVCHCSNAVIFALPLPVCHCVCMYAWVCVRALGTVCVFVRAPVCVVRNFLFGVPSVGGLRQIAGLTNLLERDIGGEATYEEQCLNAAERVVDLLDAHLPGSPIDASTGHQQLTRYFNNKVDAMEKVRAASHLLVVVVVRVLVVLPVAVTDLVPAVVAVTATLLSPSGATAEARPIFRRVPVLQVT